MRTDCISEIFESCTCVLSNDELHFLVQAYAHAHARTHTYTSKHECLHPGRGQGRQSAILRIAHIVCSFQQAGGQADWCWAPRTRVLPSEHHYAACTAEMITAMRRSLIPSRLENCTAGLEIVRSLFFSPLLPSDWAAHCGEPTKLKIELASTYLGTLADSVQNPFQKSAPIFRAKMVASVPSVPSHPHYATRAIMPSFRRAVALIYTALSSKNGVLCCFLRYLLLTSVWATVRRNRAYRSIDGPEEVPDPPGGTWCV